ncbi:PWWP domain-containing DNA repair factor 3B-like [Cololabis saira]|uniref:PWWP domain-containing DNA repair factor 3B-like n=1 Tax=Cololabis saira TaxID=129043 RepID=UPI002AD45B25|nr:PWWP domain-containing DNA repair factor 3B-like [Cololabis saira]
MKGRRCKTRKGESKIKSAESDIKYTESPVAAEESNVAPGSDVVSLCQTDLNFLPTTPTRDTERVQDANLTSTPVHSSSTDLLSYSSNSPQKAKEVHIKYAELVTPPKTSETESLCCDLKYQNRSKRVRSIKPRQVRQRAAKEQTRANCTTPKRQCGRKWATETRKRRKGETTTPLPRPRLKLENLAPSEQEEDSMLSSDLSIELSHCEEQLPSLPIQDDEKSDEEDEEDLPSFLTQMGKKPPAITDGAFVWCKYRNYPFWPAWVKSVNRKHKKVSIMFVDDLSFQQKKGLTVALKPLKPFDCEEADELIKKAKEMYDAAISWALALIDDYRIRIACTSFSGSFIEYLNHDMSYPVRRKYPQAASEGLGIANDSMMEELCDDNKEDGEEQKDASKSSKRLLPDRTHAAHNRANEKLVHFIVKQRMVEQHLLDIIHGQQQSRWLHSFLNDKRKQEVNIYLEDEHQLDKVYWYLNELYATAMAEPSCIAKVKSVEHVSYVLHVLLPEAIIYAIAGVDNVSVDKAEEKYLKGRCISNRERQEFDLMIERHMRKKAEYRTEFFCGPYT